MISYKSTLFCALAAAICPLSMAQDLDVKVSIHPAAGFMNNGWGNVNFAFTNKSAETATIQQITGQWKIKGEAYSKWGTSPRMELKGNGSASHSATLHMPGNSAALSKSAGASPYLEGEIILSNGEKAPYKIEIPVATLPSPIVSKQGKYVSVDLQESTWAKVKNPEKAAKYLDDTYRWMLDLTGCHPFEGKMMHILEAPANPYFAYAGNPIILSQPHVAGSIGHFDNDLADFGWIHEMGHNFDDVVGYWYNYGTFTEFQANIKLSYVIEKMCTKEGKYKMVFRGHEEPVDGVTFNDLYFPPYGEAYLKSDMKATEMASDHYHALFLTVIREKGWDVMKRYYKTYQDLLASGQQPPQAYDKIRLTFAILDHCSGMDLTARYKEWRIPMDRAEIDGLLKQYKIIK